MDQQQQDRQTFERTVSGLQGDMAFAGSVTIQDSAVRIRYQRQIERLVGDLRRDAEAGRLTWAEAAEQAFARQAHGLEGNHPPGLPVPSAVDDAHAAATERLEEAIRAEVLQGGRLPPGCLAGGMRPPR